MQTCISNSTARLNSTPGCIPKFAFELSTCLQKTKPVDVRVVRTELPNYYHGFGVFRPLPPDNIDLNRNAENFRKVYRFTAKSIVSKAARETGISPEEQTRVLAYLEKPFIDHPSIFFIEPLQAYLRYELQVHPFHDSDLPTAGEFLVLCWGEIQAFSHELEKWSLRAHETEQIYHLVAHSVKSLMRQLMHIEEQIDNRAVLQANEKN